MIIANSHAPTLLGALVDALGVTGVVVLVALGALYLLKYKAVRKAAWKALKRAARLLVRYVRIQLWATRLGMPYRLAHRLQRERWQHMVEARGLKGLKRGEVRRTATGVSVRVTLGGGLDLAALTARVEQLETGLGVRRKSIRLEPLDRADKAVLHVVLRDPLAKPTPWPGHPSRDIRQPVALGLTPHGEQVTLSLRQRLAVAGTTGAGKSVLARVLGGAVVASRNARLTYIDLKRVEASHWQHLATTATTPEEAELVVANLRQRMDDRLKTMAERGLDEHTPTEQEPDEVLLVDEGAELVRANLDDTITELTSIAQLGRAAGFHLWWCTQYPTNAGLPTGIGTQANGTIGLRVENKRVSDVVLGVGMAREGWRADRLRGKGWFLLRDLEHHDPDEARAYYVSADDVKSWPARGDLPEVDIDVVRHRLSLVKEPAPDELVLAVLEDAPAAGVSVETVMEGSGLGRTTVYKVLTALVEAGEAARPARGRYALPRQEVAS